MSSQWAYELPNESLIKEFMQACGRSGAANSGLVFDAFGPTYASKVRYLKGALLARLDGVEPPFCPGDIVQVQAKSDNKVHDSDYRTSLPHGSQQKVQKIHYGGNEKWFLEFTGIPEGDKGCPLFDACGFILEPPVLAPQPESK
ncbi:MAG: hypothetical protein MIO92_00715 [Methanosarcinaceae archaeon]|nr:hypothetical protein [Methanosarcinaceae archaeon]